MTLELRLDDAHSLKDKRHTVKSLKGPAAQQVQRGRGGDRLSGSVAASVVAAVTVSSDHSHAEKVLQSVEREAAALLGSELTSATVEWI
jgi:uncharacterized protein